MVMSWHRDDMVKCNVAHIDEKSYGALDVTLRPCLLVQPGATACTPCARGTFDHDADPTTKCHTCAPGNVTDKSLGAASCADCPSGAPALAKPRCN